MTAVSDSLTDTVILADLKSSVLQIKQKSHILRDEVMQEKCLKFLLNDSKSGKMTNRYYYQYK